MDIAQKLEGHQGVDVNTIEAGPVGVVVGHGRPGPYLYQKHRRHRQNIKRDGALSGGQWPEFLE
jgi:hypothetical protein